MDTLRFYLKNCMLFGVVLVVLLGGQRAYSEIEEQARSEVELWKAKIREAEYLEPAQKVEMLWLGLRNMGWRSKVQPQFTEIAQTYRQIQAVLLALPDHAKWFENEIERRRASPINTLENGTYSDYRYKFLVEALPNLPSPESVRVLGHYLSDDRDPSGNQGDSISLPENSVLACVGLSAIGLRNPPQINRTEWNVDREPWSRWFSKIQSGELAFSFVGQDVEYRFSPDGTVQTMALHKTAEELAAEALPTPVPKSQKGSQASRVATHPVPPTPSKGQTRSWPWILGAVGMLAGILAGLIAWRWMKRLRGPV